MSEAWRDRNTDMRAAGRHAKASLGGERPRSPARDAILEAARRLLRQRSFRHITLADIAVEAGVTRRTVYNHFQNREQILRCLCEAALSDVRNAMPPRIDPELALADGLFRFASDVIPVFLGPPHLEIVQAVLRDHHEQPWLRTGYARELIEPLRCVVELFLYARRARGEFGGNEVGEAGGCFVRLVLALAGAIRLLDLTAEAPAAPSAATTRALIEAFLLAQVRGGVPAGSAAEARTLVDPTSVS